MNNEHPSIKITCEGCNTIHEVRRTSEIPAHVISMGCNWCPDCEDKANDYYEEWYNESEGGPIGEDIPDNQLVMPFIIQELELSTTSEKQICDSRIENYQLLNYM